VQDRDRDRMEDSKVDPVMDELYMPSRWVKIEPERSVERYVKKTSEESQRVREQEPGQLEVRYGEEEGDWLDLFNKEAKSGYIVVFLAGGYWQELTGEISSWVVSPLVRKGHGVAIINYIRAPGQDMEGIVRQVERAGQWVVQWAVKEGKKVWFMGHSAGSHLCAMLLSSPWYDGLPVSSRKAISGVLHLSGVFQLEPLLHTSILIPSLGVDRDNVQKFSPMCPDRLEILARAGQHLVTLVVVGEHDSPAFHEQAKQYGQLLRKHGLTVIEKTVEGEDHFSLVERLIESDYSLTKDILTTVNMG